MQVKFHKLMYTVLSSERHKKNEDYLKITDLQFLLDCILLLQRGTVRYAVYPQLVHGQPCYF